MNNWLVRTISGLVLILIVFGSILWNEVSALVLTLTIFTLAYNEFRTIFKVTDKVLSGFLMVLGQTGIVFFYLFSSGSVEIHWLIFLMVGAITLLILSYLFFPGTSFKEFGLLLFATIWFSGTLSFFLSTGWLEFGDHYSPKLLIILLVLIWINDIGAFVFGSLLGKKPLALKISPGKTWEGFLAGMIISGLAGYLISIITNEYSNLFWIIVGVVSAIAATAGDLFESKLKREAGVKDSGNLIPGHGGILDRFDSLMFSTPVYYCIFLIWEKL